MIIIIHSGKRKFKVNLLKFVLSFLIICCVVTGAVSMFGNDNSVALSANQVGETVCVAYGDTLWSIASEYNDGSFDTRKIVNDIILHNNLADSSVYEGQFLEIPGKYCS